MRNIVLVGAVLALTPACSKQEAAAMDPSSGWVTIHGNVEDGEMASGQLWFKFQRQNLRFVVEASRTRNAEAIFESLQRAVANGRGVYVRIDPDDSVLDEESGLPTYAVREFLYNGERYRGHARRHLRLSERTTRSSEERAVLRAVALTHAGQYAEAQAALEKALDSELSDPRFRVLALRTRGEAIDAHVSETAPAPDGRDAALVKALDVYEQWITEEPDSYDAQYAAARVLSDLGAYDEAIERYRFIATKWPSENFWSAIRIGAIHRIRGEYQAALQVLDELEQELEGRVGMPVRYHRALSLNKIGRFDEAIAELDEGLQDQPDYMWALFARACSYAQLGRIDDAASDQKRGLELLRATWKELTMSQAARHNLDNAARIERELEGRLAANDSSPTSAPCHGYWESGEERRERSRFLAGR